MLCTACPRGSIIPRTTLVHPGSIRAHRRLGLTTLSPRPLRRDAQPSNAVHAGTLAVQACIDIVVVYEQFRSAFSPLVCLSQAATAVQ